jgi:hypothetical protein
MMQKTQTLVSIIIVNYNGYRFLKDCLDSVLAQTYSHFEVLLVDNASKDESVKFVKDNYPQIRMIESKENRGFAGGNNMGAMHAKGDLVVLLNNDTIVKEGWLQGLVDAVKPTQVALASSLILTDGIPEKYYERNGSINFLGHNIMRIYEKPKDIFFAGGASLIYKKKLIGLPFDDLYFAYAEDVYLSLKARFMGYSVTHTNESVVYHFGSATVGKKKSTLWIYYQERNRLLNTLLFFSPLTLFKLTPLFLVNMAGKLASSVVGTKYSFMGLVRAYTWLLMNIPVILSKRRQLRDAKRIDEAAVIKEMTYKITNGESLIGKFLNFVTMLYFRLVNIRTIECAGKR